MFKFKFSTMLSTATVLAGAALVMSVAQAAALADDAALIKQGEYLTRAADCVACHTADKKQPFAGGVPFLTPFGTIYSSNITPDNEKGIGTFSEEDIIRATRTGVSKHGKRLYPAMPYTSYTTLTDADAHAIAAYLKSIKPIASSPPANTLNFPFNQRWAMVFWNLFNFKEGRYQPDSSKSAEWNRGAYLAIALGHCQECHTPRNLTMGLSSSLLGGGQVGNWQAYNISSAPIAGVGGWSQAELVSYLRTGFVKDKGSAAGPMAEVVENSTRYMSPEDLQALVTYLRTVPAMKEKETRARFAWGNPYTNVDAIRGRGLAEHLHDGVPNGAALFNSNCASCHSVSGSGIGADTVGAYPGLLHNSAVGAPAADNLIAVILHGVSRESHDNHAFMPAFSQLSDEEVAALVNFVTQQFGNPAATTTAAKVKQAR